MNADLFALVNAILSAPDDDLLRLVYADWLEEHEKPTLAELTRLQCGVADHRDRKRGHMADIDDLATRRNVVHNLPEFYTERGAPWAQWGYFYRGLISYVTFPLDEFDPIELNQLGHTYGLQHIFVEKVTDVEKFAALLHWPVLSHIPTLTVTVDDPTGTITGTVLSIIARQRWTQKQEEVRIQGLSLVDRLAADGMRELENVIDDRFLQRVSLDVNSSSAQSPLIRRFQQIVRSMKTPRRKIR